MTDTGDDVIENRRIDGVRLRKAGIYNVDVRGSELAHGRMRGVELYDLDISGEVNNVVINGVDIGPLIEAELNRRDPDRALMRPEDPDGFREAWELLESLWEGTVDRARTFPEDALHVSVDEEWSFIQTIRHLNFANAAWVSRMVLGVPSPWHPLDIPWDEAPGWDGIPWDRDARPSLDEVLAVRSERQATMREVLAGLTEEELGSQVSRTEPGWPQIESFPFRECLLIVLNEEWHHRLFAERDLDAIPREPSNNVGNDCSS